MPTNRDLYGLRWCAEMYCVRLDTFALLLGALGPAAPASARTSPGRELARPGDAYGDTHGDEDVIDAEVIDDDDRDGGDRNGGDRNGNGSVVQAAADQIQPVTHRRAQAVAERWERAGWATRARMLNRQWIVPTVEGYKQAGIEPRRRAGEELPPDVLVMEPWAPRAWPLAHIHAAGLVRLAVERTLAPGQRWVSERELRREARDHPEGNVRKVFDGAIESGELVDSEFGSFRPRAAIEVELTLKSPGDFRETVQRPVPLGITGMRWFAPSRLVPLIRHNLDTMHPTVRDHYVDPLPRFAGAPYMTEMSNRLEE